MIKAVIGKNNVDVYQDDREIADIWGAKVEIHVPTQPDKPFISVHQELSGFISFVHPDEVEFEKGVEGPPGEKEKQCHSES